MTKRSNALGAPMCRTASDSALAWITYKTLITL